MSSIVIIDKGGKVKEQNIKEFKESELYKKAGFKSDVGFKKHTTWTFNVKENKYKISLYAKNSGKSGQENKYEFPPPVDKTLFFGSCVLVNFIVESDDSLKQFDLHVQDWKDAYNYLMGGFDDLDGDEEDSEDVDDDDEIPENTGIEGYERDGFVVDDDEGDFNFDDEKSEDSEVEEKALKKKKDKLKKIAAASVSSSSSSKKSRSNKKKETTVTEPSGGDLYLDCQSELVEEEYL